MKKGKTPKNLNTKNLKRGLSVVMAAALMANTAIGGVGINVFASEFTSDDETAIEVFSDEAGTSYDVPMTDGAEKNEAESMAARSGGGTGAINTIKAENFSFHTDGSLAGFNLSWNFAGGYANAKCRVGIQTTKFREKTDTNEYGDFTNFGEYAKKYSNYEDWPNKPDDCGFIAWLTDPFTMSSQGCNATLDKEKIPLNQDKTYYLYLWTSYNNSIYPDAYVYTLKTGSGQIKDGNDQLIYSSHNWNYQALDNVITASCTDEGCQYHGSGSILKIEATNAEYNPAGYAGNISLKDGQENSVSVIDGKFPVTDANIGPVKYYKDINGTETTTDGDGASASGGAPKNVGTYYAGITVGGVTAYAEFEITQATNVWIHPTTIAPCTYGDIITNKLFYEAKFGNVEVQYLSDKGAILNDTPTGAGNYTAQFTVPETLNYTRLSEDIDFSISPRPVKLKWSSTNANSDNMNYDYDGTEKQITATVNNKVNDADEFTLTYEDNDTYHNKAANPGTYKAKVKELGNPNYTLDDASGTEQVWSITRRSYPSYNPVYVTGISVTPEKTTLTQKDETVQLAATITPSYADNKTVTWKSSDEKVATVDKDGKVTAVANGTAMITATSVSGNHTATAEVNVKIPVEVEKIILTADKQILTEAGETAQITAAIEPSNADNQKLIWKSDNEEIATVDANGKVTALTNGTVTITASTEDGQKTASIEIKVEITEKPGDDQTIRKTSGFRWLRARSTRQSKSAIRLNWNSLSDVDGYIIYGALCNENGVQYECKKLATITDNTTNTWVHKKLKKGTFYKYIVKAYKVIDGKKVITDTSTYVHAVTSGGRYGVAKAVSIVSVGDSQSVTKIIMDAGQTAQINAREVKKDKKIRVHRKIKYESSNTKVATVSSEGLIEATGKGTCKIWVYAQNGVYKTITIIVK